MGEQDIVDVKIGIKSVLASSPTRMNVGQLYEQYNELIGAPIPYKKFGFHSRLQFLKSLPDTLKVNGYGPTACVIPILSAQNAHVVDMIRKQKIREGHGRSLMRNTAIILNNPMPLTSEPQKSTYCPMPRATRPYQDGQGASGIGDSRVPYAVQENLKYIIKTCPNGICMTELRTTYEQRFQTKLKFNEYGYSTLLALCLSLPKIFHYRHEHWGSGKVYDASTKDTRAEEYKIMRNQRIEQIITNKPLHENFKTIENDPLHPKLAVEPITAVSNDVLPQDLIQKRDKAEVDISMNNRSKELAESIHNSQELKFDKIQSDVAQAAVTILQQEAEGQQGVHPMDEPQEPQTELKYIKTHYFGSQTFNVVIIENFEYMLPQQLFRVFAANFVVRDSAYVRYKLHEERIPLKYACIECFPEDLRNELVRSELIAPSQVFLDFVSCQYFYEIIRCIDRYAAAAAATLSADISNV